MITISWVEESTGQLPEGGDAFNFEFGTLNLDIAEADNYEVASLVTEHSVEGREQINDHHVPQLDRASVDVVVSESPSARTIGEGTTISDIELGTGKSASVITVPDGTTRTADIFDELRRLTKDGVEVDVEGLRRPIEGWLIESVSSPRSVETAGALICTLAFVEVSIASVSEVDAPSPRVERGRQGRDRGRQRPSEAGASNVSPDPTFRDTGEQSLREDWYNTQTGEV